MAVQYHNRRPASKEILNSTGVNVTYVWTLKDLLATSEVVSVHVPLSAATHHFISAPEVAQMKRGVVFINMARGPVVDEVVLVAALKSGQVWSAGLDVFEEEPKVHSGLLERNINTVLLPHIGTATVGTRRQMEAMMLGNVMSALEKGKLKTPVPECDK